MSVKRLQKMALGKKEYDYNPRAALNHNKVEEIAFEPGAARLAPPRSRPAPPAQRPANAVRAGPPGSAGSGPPGGRGRGLGAGVGPPTRPPGGRPAGNPKPHVPAPRHEAPRGQAGHVATFAPSTLGVVKAPIEGPPPGFEPAPDDSYGPPSKPLKWYPGAVAATMDAVSHAVEEPAPVYSNPHLEPVLDTVSDTAASLSSHGDTGVS
jgi:hypothetical protein